MRVFVLGTGRCGSTTFSKACGHATNLTCAHESPLWGPGGFLAFPDDHVEVNPGLTWLVPSLARATWAEDRFVWLVRDRAAVIRSWIRRGKGAGPIRWYRLFAGSKENVSDEKFAEICEACYDWMTDLISEFVMTREHAKVVAMEEAVDWFPGFWEWIGAEGDLDAAVAEWSIRYNAS